MPEQSNQQKSHIRLYTSDDKPLTELKALAANIVAVAERLNIENGGSELEIGDIVEKKDEDGFYHAVEVWGDLKTPLAMEDTSSE